MDFCTSQIQISLDEKEVSKKQVCRVRFSVEMKQKHLKVGR